MGMLIVMQEESGDGVYFGLCWGGLCSVVDR